MAEIFYRPQRSLGFRGLGPLVGFFYMNFFYYFGGYRASILLAVNSTFQLLGFLKGSRF